MNPSKIIDKSLNGITMYRLLVYGLSALLALSIGLSLLGKLPISALSIAVSSAVILSVGFIADRALPILWSSTANKDSSLITCLILCCILPPSTSIHNLALLALGALVAIASKYILVYHHKHPFNPAAIAALVLGLTNLLPAIWWIGSPALLPATIVFGLLVLRKVKRFQLFFGFLIASLGIGVILGLMHNQSISYVLMTAFKSSPLIFLGTIMLTEPSTTPPRIWQQRIYGLIVGALFMSQLRFGLVTATPELALIVGNVYVFLVSPKYKLRLRFKQKTQLAPGVYDFSFSGAKSIKFNPGQYMEWTLPNVKTDSRGNRRIFSIASASEEDEIHFAVKTSNSGSNYKKSLLSLKADDLIVVGQVSGDFILPKSNDQKLVFIAGGIGITPFVSMAKSIIKSKVKRDIVLLYFISSPNDFCYKNVWLEASKFGLVVIPIMAKPDPSQSWGGLTGRLTSQMLDKQVPDYLDRRFYISGPNALVENYTKLLRMLKINQKQIVTDYFSGY
jgi:ferredoxin-NADP reductase